MLFSDARREFDQQNLRLVLEKLHGARKLLQRLLSDKDAPASEQQRLKAAADELELAIAPAESHLH